MSNIGFEWILFAAVGFVVGWLIPESRERYSRYSFKKRDLEDLELILRMKEQEFSLQEIHTMLALRRTSNMVEPHTISQFTALYSQKKHELRDRISRLNRALESVEKDEEMLTETAPKPLTATGVPLRALSLLECPRCGGRFKLENADLDARYIYRGTLRCSCGDVLMETHINSFFFAYNHLDVLPRDCIYIAVDRYPEMLREYKRLLESMGEERDFLFIADNSFNFPLRKCCVDILVNCMSDNEFSLYDPGSYIEKMKPYLKDTAKVAGTLLSFDGITKSQRRIHEKYPEGSELPYSRARTERQYKEAGFAMELISQGTVTETAHKDRYAWSCHVPGDVMQISYMSAKRR